MMTNELQLLPASTLHLAAAPLHPLLCPYRLRITPRGSPHALPACRPPRNNTATQPASVL